MEERWVIKSWQSGQTAEQDIIRYQVTDTKERALGYILAQADEAIGNSCRKRAGEEEDMQLRHVRIDLKDDESVEVTASGRPENMAWYNWKIFKASVLPDQGAEPAEPVSRTITRKDILWDRKIDMGHAWLEFQDRKATAGAGQDTLAEPFLHFPAGTNYVIIEQWFKNNYPGGLEALRRSVEA